MSSAPGGSAETARCRVPSPRRRITPASPSLASTSAVISSSWARSTGLIVSSRRLKSALRSASSRTLAWARRKSRQISTTRSAVPCAISRTLWSMCVGERAGDLLAHLVLGGLALHLLGDDGQHAVAEVPDVLGDQHHADHAGHGGDQPAQHRAEHALADARRHAGNLPPQHQHHGPGDTLLALDQHLAGGDLGAALGRIDGILAARIRAHHAGHRRAVAPPEEGLHALGRGAGGVDDGQLDALADLLADVRRDPLDALLDGIRAIDPLGGRCRQLLRALSREAREDHSWNQVDSSRTWAMASSTWRSIVSSNFSRRQASATSGP